MFPFQVAIILLDTQGTFDTESSVKVKGPEPKLVTLAHIIGSYFIEKERVINEIQTHSSFLRRALN